METLFIVMVGVIAVSQIVRAVISVLGHIDYKSKRMPAGRKAGQYEVEAWEDEDVED